MAIICLSSSSFKGEYATINDSTLSISPESNDLWLRDSTKYNKNNATVGTARALTEKTSL